jgi:hypothetical protein
MYKVTEWIAFCRLQCKNLFVSNYYKQQQKKHGGFHLIIAAMRRQSNGAIVVSMEGRQKLPIFWGAEGHRQLDSSANFHRCFSDELLFG